MELTEVEFWNNFWANCKLPNEADLSFSFDRCLAAGLIANVPAVKGDVFEVGCAPGKWLAFMAKKFGLNPHGIEYSEAGMNATLNNFKLLGLSQGAVQSGDFFSTKPDRQFDVVMSFGFIEHFDNVDEVVRLHIDWLKPGGILILGVPNFKGIYYFLQKILDKELLDKHNLEVMNLDYFTGLADKFNLKPVFLNYLGSFEPDLLAPKYRYGNPLQFMIKSLLWIARRIRRLRFFDAINNKFFSSYILAVYQNGEQNSK